MLTIKQNLTAINQWQGRFGHKVKGVVIHSMYGTYNGSISWFKNPKAMGSAHYCIKSDGEITLSVIEENSAWHAGVVTTTYDKAPQLLKDNFSINFNTITIGIELEDFRDRKRVYPNPQYRACVELVADICKRHGIIPNRGNIVMHKEIDPINRTDPIGKWDQDKFVADVIVSVSDKQSIIYPVEPQDVEITSDVGLNIRDGATRMHSILRVLPKGDKIRVSSFVEGETIEGNDLWWIISGTNNYVWSGGTSLLPSLSQKDTTGENKMEDKVKVLEAERDAIYAQMKELDAQASAKNAEISVLIEEAKKAEEVAADPVSEVVAEVTSEVVVEEVKAEVVEQEAVVEHIEAEETGVKAEIESLKAKLEGLLSRL